MSENQERLSDVEVGERLRIAREAAKLKQAEAADIIGAARTTIVAIEQGHRRIRTDELQKLARAYGTSANAILRREAVSLDLVAQFRKLQSSADKAVEEASALLNDLVRAEVELENALGIMRSRNYPPERPLLPGDVVVQAEQDAQQLRDWLGLGPGPIADMISVLEMQLGIRVYVRRMNARISGLFAFDEAAGACMLLNAGHSRERNRHTAAHELGHFISSRRQLEVLTDKQGSTREERYATSFAPAFLMPARAVQQQFAELTAGQTHLTRRHIILMAHCFGVSRQAMVRRLEDLKLAKKGTWDWFERNGGISDGQAREVLGDFVVAPEPPTNGPLPHRLGLLARETWKLEIYSEGQLANLLRLDRHEIRELLAGAESEGSEADDIVKILR